MKLIYNTVQYHTVSYSTVLFLRASDLVSIHVACRTNKTLFTLERDATHPPNAVLGQMICCFERLQLKLIFISLILVVSSTKLVEDFSAVHYQ